MFKFRLTIYVLIILWLFNSNVYGQPIVFGPIGAMWYYTPYESQPSNSLFIFKSERDTIMYGFNARIISCFVYENGELSRIDSLTKYISTVGDKVFYKVANSFSLLYDFGASPGDTIHSSVEEFPIFMGCNTNFTDSVIEFTYVIDSNNVWDINGELLKVQFIRVIDSPQDQENWYLNNPIIERIGQIGYGATWWGVGDICLPGGVGYLRCYYDADIYFKNPNYNSNLSCEFTNIAESINDNSFIIYPNPASSFINIPLNAKNIAILDFVGRVISLMPDNNVIDISDFIPGYYIIRFQVNGILNYEKFMKV
jgi:hypothetical protein